MASSILHPYQYSSSRNLNVQNHAMAHVPIANLSQGISDSTSNGVSFTRPSQPQTLPQRTPFSFHLPPVVMRFAFLPIPPLLSLLYIATGHAILRQIHKSSPSSIYHTPILSSIEAGATGGVIFSLPALLLLYLLIFYRWPHSVPEDFFEDDSDTTGLALWYIRYFACVFLLVGIGAIAGPLGVISLSHGVLNSFVITKKMLSTGAAAAAGILGGVVLSVAILFLGALTTLVWSFWIRKSIFVNRSNSSWYVYALSFLSISTDTSPFSPVMNLRL